MAYHRPAARSNEKTVWQEPRDGKKTPLRECNEVVEMGHRRALEPLLIAVRGNSSESGQYQIRNPVGVCREARCNVDRRILFVIMHQAQAHSLHSFLRSYRSCRFISFQRSEAQLFSLAKFWKPFEVANMKTTSRAILIFIGVCTLCTSPQLCGAAQSQRGSSGPKTPPDAKRPSTSSTVTVPVPLQDAVDSYVRRDYATAFKKWLALAERGNAFAQSWVASSYFAGRGVEPNEAEALKWLRAAAEQGDTSSMETLGVQLLVRDRQESDKWKKASETTKVSQKVTRENEEAASLFRAAAAQGNAVAQEVLGDLYSSGRGVPEDNAQAALWYRKAADSGNASAQSSLGSFYENGYGVPQSDSEALYWYRKAADAGFADAQAFVGEYYEKGKGVQKSLAEALKWYRRAAEGGYYLAYHNLGDIYANADGVPIDLAEAERSYQMYEEACQRRGATTSLALNIFYRGVAKRYKEGASLPKNPSEAIRWYRKAADKGDTLAQNALGEIYQKGDGVQREIWLKQKSGIAGLLSREIHRLASGLAVSTRL